MKARHVLLSTLSALALSCTSPAQPSPPTAGITLYVDDGYRGAFFTATSDVPDLKAVRVVCSDNGDDSDDNLNDCVSSVRVAPGWRAIAYVDSAYRGQLLELREDIPDLSRMAGPCGKGFNDCLSSLRVMQQSP